MMAIVIRNKSLCFICNKTIGDTDRIIAFPSIITNEKSPLFDFNDRAFHQDCFEKHVLAVEALELVSLWERKTASRECFICREQIADPVDYYSFPFFCNNIESMLCELNYAQVHRSCVKKWDKLGQVLQNIEEFQNDDLWDDDLSKKILEELKEFAGE
jgi:hypothetical protein